MFRKHSVKDAARTHHSIEVRAVREREHGEELLVKLAESAPIETGKTTTEEYWDTRFRPGLTISLRRDNLLTALRSAINGLLQESAEPKDIALKIETQLRSLAKP